MPLLSIIIPVFNVGNYLEECLDSILEQNLNDLEIILIDDASGDRSRDICDNYARLDFIHLIRHDKNTGVSVARNHGIKRASGDFILYVDGDDKIMAGGLASLMQTISEHPHADVIVTRYESQNGETSNDFLFQPHVIASSTPEVLFDHINRGLFHPDPCWHYAIERWFLLKNKLFFLDVKIAEDQEYVARLLTTATTINFCPAPFYWYRERDGSLKKSHDTLATAALLIIASAIGKHKRTLSPEPARTEFLNRCIDYAIGRFAARLTTHGDTDIREIVRMIPDQDFRELSPLFKEADMEGLVAEFGIAPALVSYRNTLDQITLALLPEGRDHKIYLYCTGPTGTAVLHTLRTHKFPVEGFIDDNKSLQGRTLSGVPVLTSAAFARLPASTLAQAQVIVCIPRIPTFKRIAENLLGMGLALNQVAHRKF